MINRLKSYRNGVHGEFFLSVAAELERLQKLSETRLETIRAMSGFLDDVAEALDIPKPGTPIEGVDACWKIIQTIQNQKDVIEKIARVTSGEDQVADDDTEGMKWISDFMKDRFLIPH